MYEGGLRGEKGGREGLKNQIARRRKSELRGRE